MRVVKAAGVQLSPVLYSREGTVERVWCAKSTGPCRGRARRPR
jgi:hypothetical protein